MQISYMDMPHAPTAAASAAGDSSADQAPATVQSSSLQKDQPVSSAADGSHVWSTDGPSSSAAMGTVDVVWPPSSSAWVRNLLETAWILHVKNGS